MLFRSVPGTEGLLCIRGSQVQEPAGSSPHAYGTQQPQSGLKIHSVSATVLLAAPLSSCMRTTGSRDDCALYERLRQSTVT